MEKNPQKEVSTETATRG